MLNCLQVKSIICNSPEELQLDLNLTLAELGKRVQNIHFVDPLGEGFACMVSYWSQDIPAAITTKCEEMPGDEPLFVAVITQRQREMVLLSLEDSARKANNLVLDENKHPDYQNNLAMERDIYFEIAKRFAHEEQQDIEISEDS